MKKRFFSNSRDSNIPDGTICDNLCKFLRETPHVKHVVLYLDSPDINYHSNLPKKLKRNADAMLRYEYG